MAEVRIKNETTGGEKGQKPERHELVPINPMDWVARVYHYGTEKYDPHNWRKGYDWSLSYGALQRHLRAFWNGQELDDESGLPHLAHAVFHCLALMEFGDTHPELDDRWSTINGRESKSPDPDDVRDTWNSLPLSEG